MTTNEAYGQVDISPAAIATIANQAVHQCYGVVGMANKNLVDGITSALSKENRRGIEVSFDNDGSVIIDVFVIVQYGTRIRVVAESIQNTVKFHIEKALSTPVTAVNVYVQGVHKSE